MKLLYIFLLLLSINSYNAIAQEFAPISSQWFFQFWSLNSNQIVSFYKSFVNHDTIIDTRYVTGMSLERDNSFIPEAEILINEQNNQVYFYENQTFKLFFDFNLIAGDTLTFSVPENYFYYDISCGNEPEFSVSQLSRIRIDSISQTIFGGQFLNVFHTSPIEDTLSQYFNWDLGNVVQRIGSLNGIFGHSTTQCLGGDIGYFRCYSDNLIQIQNSIEECDFILSSNPNSTYHSQLSVYPNPTQNVLNLKVNKHSKSTAEIYNQLGQLLLTRDINLTQQLDYESFQFDFENGLYYLKVKSENFQETIKFQVIK